MKHHDSRQVLRDCRIRVTPRKIAILGEIMACGSPIGAGDIHSRVSAVMPLDLATVYRSIDSFLKHGIIREIADDNGVQKYEMACDHNPSHPHFKCLKCRRITCLDTFERAEMAPLISRCSGSRTITDISITISGICEKCR